MICTFFLMSDIVLSFKILSGVTVPIMSNELNRDREESWHREMELMDEPEKEDKHNSTCLAS